MILPLLAALATIPVLVRLLGAERFGILTLCWAMAGYFNLFDMGLGRAIVLRVSRLRGEGREEDVSRAYWTGLATLAGVGAVLCGGVLAASEPVVASVLRIPVHLREEAVASFLVTGLTLPLALVFGGMGSFLVAQHRQRELNLIRIPVGLLSHLGAAGIVMLGGDLVDLAWWNFALRVGSLLAAWRVIHGRASYPWSVSVAELVVLAGMGSWMMVTNLLAPLATQLDRFLVGRGAGLEAVAHYSTAMDLALKVWSILATLAPVLFPVLGELARRDPVEAKRLFRKAVLVTMVAGILCVAFLQIFGKDLLAIWIGKSFSEGAWRLVAILGSGVMASLLANLGFNLVQAFEGPRRTALAHVALLVLHLGLILVLLPRLGVAGVALAFVLRYLAEAAVFLWMASGHGVCDRSTFRIVAVAAGIHVLAATGSVLATGWIQRGALLAATGALVGFWWLRESGLLRTRGSTSPTT